MPRPELASPSALVVGMSKPHRGPGLRTPGAVPAIEPYATLVQDGVELMLLRRAEENTSAANSRRDGVFWVMIES